MCAVQSLCDSGPYIRERKQWDIQSSKERNSLFFHVVQRISQVERVRKSFDCTYRLVVE